MAGKSILSIPVSSANPFTENIEKAYKNVASQVGFSFTEWSNQGQPSQWVQGMGAAINRHVNLVDLLGGTDPRVLRPQVQSARAKGILVVASHYSGMEQSLPSYISGAVPIHYNEAGRLLADWAILKTKGRADVLVITSDEVYSTGSMVSGLRDEFQKRCGSSCSEKFVNVPVPDWSTKIQPNVQSAINGDPKLNYVILIYDSMSQFVVPAVISTHAVGRVKVATFNGTPFVLGYIQTGKIVEMDIGEDLDWIGRAIMDDEMRMVARLKPVRDEHIPLYIFDKSNARSAGTPPRLSTGYGHAYIDGYNKLWEVSK
jgi:ribose transport system substrate-binding protein